MTSHDLAPGTRRPRPTGPPRAVPLERRAYAAAAGDRPPPPVVMVFSRSRLWVRRDDSIHALAVRRTLAGHDPALTPGELTESAESAESAEAAGAAGAAGGTRWQSLGDAALYVADRGPSLVAVGRLAVLAGAGFAPVCSPPAGWQAPADFPLVPARCRHTLTGACARTTLRRPGDPAPAERALCRS